jgi:hypothetical protein
MTVERSRITPRTALRMLLAAHERAEPPNRAVVAGLAQQMLDADEAGVPWEQGPDRRIVVSRIGGVIVGVEVLLALVHVGRARELHVDSNAPLQPYLSEVGSKVGLVVAGNGTELTTKLAVDAWVEDPGPTSPHTPWR